MTKKALLVFVALLLVVALPAPAALDGSMSGVVKDNTGQPLPGVSVQVTGTVLQGMRSAVTRGDGTFSIPSLPPGGGYRVVFALPGFATVDRKDLFVALGKDTQANATLNLSAVTSEVVVTGEAPAVDTTQTNTQQNFSKDYLKKLPIGSANRSYQSILAQAPGVAGGGNPNVLGGNILENSFLVDGINTTDPVTHTFAFNLNFDAIQEVSIQTSSFLAEYGRANGGIVNVVTKSGGNEFSGSADIRYSTNKFSESSDSFNPDLAESRNSPWGVTLGGPIVKDRIWFFGNLQRPDNFRTPVTTNAVVLAQNPKPVVRAFKGWNDGLKLSFTATDQLNGFVNVTDALATIPGQNDSVLYRPEASSTQRQRARIYNLKLNGILSANWLADFQVGREETQLETGPTFSTLEQSTWTNRTGGGVIYDAYNNYQISERNRNVGGFSTTYFLSDFIGNHQIKMGGDVDRTEFPSLNITTGTPSDPSFCPAGLVCGATFQFNGGADYVNGQPRTPFSQSVSERRGVTTRTGNSYSAYIQDQWRPIPQLTLNLGVRWDKSALNNNQNIESLTFDKLQPRLAASYDILGDGKNIVRASYGTFYVDAGLTVARILDAGGTSAVGRTYLWNVAQNKYLLSSQTGGNPITASLIDPSIEGTFDQQVNIGFEREVFKGASLGFSYIYKKTKNIFENSCMPPNFTQAACTDLWLTNFPGRGLPEFDESPLKKNYYGYVLQFQYGRDRYQVNASYTYSKSQGSIDSSGGQYASAEFNFYPGNYLNSFGYLSDDARNRFKVAAAYRIPFIETDLAANYNYRSGLPLNITSTAVPGSTGLSVLVEPRGTSRTAVLHTLDMELKKSFTLPFKNLQVTLIGSVFNAINSEQPISYFTSADSPTTVRTPASFQRPRNYEIGFRLDF